MVAKWERYGCTNIWGWGKLIERDVLAILKGKKK